jgi:hypothetical protein
MTAVMRAVAPARGPKILRIGLVQAGRVVDERIIKQRSPVTVGASEKATFVIPSEAVSAPYKLFEIVGGDYCLNFVDGMSGRVALDGALMDIGALKERATRVGDGYRVKLTEDARGKIVVGETTFLFQFVAPPPVQPRPQLPLAVMGGLASEIDWTLTMIAAFSFMVHFGLIGALCSDWMDPIVADDVSVAGLIDLVRSVPPPPIEERVIDATQPPERTAPVQEPKHTATTGARAPAPKGATGPRTSEAEAKLMAARAEVLKENVLVAFGGTSAVENALERSDVVPVDLTDAVKTAEGVGAARNDGLHFGSGAKLIEGHSGFGAIAGATGTGIGDGRGDGGPAPAGPPLKAQARIDTPISSDNIGAERVVAGLQGRFRRCYEQGLALDPGMSGSVTILAKVLPNGEVSTVAGSGNTGLSEAVVKCISRALKDATFGSSPAGSSLQVPTKFVSSR